MLTSFTGKIGFLASLRSFAQNKENVPFKMGRPKDFPIEDWKAVRDAASRCGKKYGRKFVTRKMNIKGQDVIRVFWES